MENKPWRGQVRLSVNKTQETWSLKTRHTLEQFDGDNWVEIASFVSATPRMADPWGKDIDV